jgi:hypothetical protein
VLDNQMLLCGQQFIKQPEGGFFHIRAVFALITEKCVNGSILSDTQKTDLKFTIF